jgi:hypothetical protein
MCLYAGHPYPSYVQALLCDNMTKEVAALWVPFLWAVLPEQQGQNTIPGWRRDRTHMMAIIQAPDGPRNCGILKWRHIAKYPSQSGILGAPWYHTFSDHPHHLGERFSSRKRRDTAHRRRPKTTAVLRYGLIQAIAKFQFKHEKGKKSCGCCLFRHRHP